MNELILLKNRFSVMMKEPSVWTRCHLGLSLLARRSQCLTSKLPRTGWPSSVVMQLVTWSECSHTIWKVPRPVEVMLQWLCLCCINGTTKSVYTSVYNLVYWIANPLLRTTTQKGKEKKFLSKYLCSLIMHLFTQEWCTNDTNVQWDQCFHAY